MQQTIFYLFLLLTLLIHTSHAQTTAIPDNNFEQKLINLGIDSDGIINGQILNSDAAAVTHLPIQSSNIADLTGISAFVNLDSLECYGNTLQQLQLLNHASLTYLNCITNNLTNIDISGSPALTHFYCSYNSLTQLDLSNNANLIWIECRDNQLTNLDFSQNTVIEHIRCNDNNLTSVDISACVNLNIFTIYRNNLSTIDISNNPSLTIFSCLENNLNQLDVSNNPQLYLFNCSQNNLTSINLSNNAALRYLTINNNNLTTLDVSNNPILEDLECTGNNITTLDLSANPELWDLYCFNNNITELNVSNSPDIRYFNCNNNQLSYLDISNLHNLNEVSTLNNLPLLQVCVHDTSVANNNINWLEDPSTIYTEVCHPFAVHGHMVIDSNSNCAVDSLEIGFPYQLIEFKRLSDNHTSYFSTLDNSGYYQAFLDTGTYLVTAIPQTAYWQACPSTQLVTIDTSYTLQTLDWTLDAVVSCPLIQVDIAAPFLRKTGGGSPYHISYCNFGTAPATNASITVDIDPDLHVLSTSLPIASQNGNTLTFNVGNLTVGECQSMNIQVIIDSAALLGQTHCTEVHATPDSLCLPIWSGPILKAQATCLNDSIFFEISNIGSNSIVPHQYFVFEDNIVMRTGNIQVNAGQSVTIVEEAGMGKTYRIEVAQAAGFPAILGDPIVTASREGCNTFPDGSFNVGFITQLYNGNSSPFTAIDCQQGIAAYDPNDKAAQPAGYGTPHYIHQNIPLDYKIRFQNTGNDTAFNVVILDTISNLLDISSLQMGASSHPYTWTIVNGHTLKVSFPNIMLVDSNANEPLSHGFFRYRINQQLDNPLGTIIENRAAIYFDYNPPIITNTTFHTVGDNFLPIVLSIENTLESNVAVSAFPNPFTNSTTIKVEGQTYDELQLSVFDLTGRLMTEKTVAHSQQLELQRGSLHTGIYIYRLKGDGQLLNTGKIIVQ